MADENSYRDIKLIIKFVWNPLFLTQVYVKFTQVCVKHKKRRSGGGGVDRLVKVNWFAFTVNGDSDNGVDIGDDMISCMFES